MSEHSEFLKSIVNSGPSFCSKSSKASINLIAFSLYRSKFLLSFEPSKKVFLTFPINHSFWLQIKDGSGKLISFAFVFNFEWKTETPSWLAIRNSEPSLIFNEKFWPVLDLQWKTEIPSYRVIELSSYRVTELSSYRVNELPSYRVIELSNYRVIELPSYRVTELSSYRVTELSSYRVNELPS